MIESTPRLLTALKCVSDAGSSLAPIWDPNAPRGFLYGTSGSVLDDAALVGDLEELAERDYLERVFVDRLSLCPNCGSHALNVREICLECHGSRITPVETVVHFRCGFVGPASFFTQEAGGRRCPKCRRLLQELGTDHGRPGDYFACGTCNATFQVPDVGGLCLSCGGRFPANQMNGVRSRDVYAYRLTGLGRAALTEGRLGETDRVTINDRDGWIYRRRALLDLIEDECRRRRSLSSTFGLIVFEEPGAGAQEHANGEGTAALIRPFLGEADKLGRLNARHLVAVLSGASKRRTRAMMQRIQRLQLKAVTVEGSDAADIVGRLDAFAP